jgi:hypothetical protein
VPIFLKSGSLKPLEPSGPVQDCNGIALPLTFYLSARYPLTSEFAYKQEAPLKGAILTRAACNALYEKRAAIYIYIFFFTILQFLCGYVESDRNSVISFVERLLKLVFYLLVLVVMLVVVVVVVVGGSNSSSSSNGGSISSSSSSSSCSSSVSNNNVINQLNFRIFVSQNKLNLWAWKCFSSLVFASTVYDNFYLLIGKIN